MKKLVLILCLSVAFVASVFAQENFENNPRVKELRKKFYDRELAFTPDESKAFWPLFSQLQREQRKLRKQYNAGADIDIMEDKDAEAHLEKMFEYDQKKADLKKKYFDKFSEVLPIRKVAKIEATERKFKREVLKRVRKNRQKRRN